jgi:hypothetical protein
MRAFEVSLNGKKLCVAGVGDTGVLTAIVNWVGKGGDGDFGLEVGGLITPSNQHVSWIPTRPLQVEDEVHIRIVETDRVDEPLQKNTPKTPASRQIGGIIGPF